MAGRAQRMKSRLRQSSNHRGGVAAMIAILGTLIVFVAVIGGLLMEKGHLGVLIQPAELLIIAGAATGTLRVANPSTFSRRLPAGLRAFSRAPAWASRAISTRSA
jgi:chemotaxis protein MotA